LVTVSWFWAAETRLTSANSESSMCNYMGLIGVDPLSGMSIRDCNLRPLCGFCTHFGTAGRGNSRASDGLQNARENRLMRWFQCRRNVAHLARFRTINARLKAIHVHYVGLARVSRALVDELCARSNWLTCAKVSKNQLNSHT
jgi:hypothetical protein